MKFDISDMEAVRRFIEETQEALDRSEETDLATLALVIDEHGQIPEDWDEADYDGSDEVYLIQGYAITVDRRDKAITELHSIIDEDAFFEHG